MFVSLILIYFIYLVPGIEDVNASSTMQNSTYENPNLEIKIEHPMDWKPIEKMSTITNANIIEFVPIVLSEHDPLTPFFSISVEAFNDTKHSTTIESSGITSNESALVALTERNMGLAESLPEFDIVELNETSFLSSTPAYKIVYTFADPGSPLHPKFETMNIWTIKKDKVYTISYTADKTVFLNHLPTIQDMIDSFVITDN